MASLLGALLANESGGRNVPNVHQGTSSGQAQGYFQITTGTWDEYGGRKYAANPLQASYAQQAEIASKIPLKRWDESTVAKMRATGKNIDTNKTLGENLSASGEDIFNLANAKDGGGATGGAGGGNQQVASAASPPKDDSGPLLMDFPTRSLADDLSSSVDAPLVSRGDTRSVPTPVVSEDAGFTPAPEFASAIPEAPPPVPDPTPAGLVADISAPLADLFKVKDIGQAGAVDPRTGQPVLPKPFRALG